MFIWKLCTLLGLCSLRGFRNVHLETDNLHAFYHVKNFRDGVPEELYDLVQQIDMIRSDPRWTISIFLIYPRRNTLAKYLAYLGGQLDRKADEVVQNFPMAREILPGVLESWRCTMLS
ncbi:hypothetical protein POM88_038114 [Heracleum sosnowskyi]|uniref:RNase H type-1 domain-containing protein n=1 Tax=Heracleum sosnowskyi TaxID=360622 RepID=A0AAD8HRE0_9APIA|nr:hypothetical protein POM88_038114 [Heracleum sosnowskyi]